MKLCKYFVIALASCIFFTNSLDAMLAQGARVFARRAPAFTGAAARADVLAARRAWPVAPVMGSHMPRRAIPGTYYDGSWEKHPWGEATGAVALGLAGLLLYAKNKYDEPEARAARASRAQKRAQERARERAQEKIEKLQALVAARNGHLIYLTIFAVPAPEDAPKEVVQQSLEHKDKLFFGGLNAYYISDDFPLVSAGEGYKKLLMESTKILAMFKELVAARGEFCDDDQKKYLASVQGALEREIKQIRCALQTVKDHKDYYRQVLIHNEVVTSHRLARAANANALANTVNAAANVVTAMNSDSSDKK